MTNHSRLTERKAEPGCSRPVGTIFSGLALLFILAFAGCQTGRYGELEKMARIPDEIVLHEGDSVRITFAGAPNLNTVQTIRRDGRIALQLVGEFQAAGLTPTAMEKELLKLYGPQLQTKEVTVAVESSSFPIYITGAVLRPGKIMTDRPLTALEAIMEAGGFDYTKANLKSVTVLRRENGRSEHFTLNLKRALAGGEDESFNMRPADIIYVPEKFSWF